MLPSAAGEFTQSLEFSQLGGSRGIVLQ